MGTLRKIGAQTAPKSFQTEKRAVQPAARVDNAITRAAWKGLQTGTLPISGKAADTFLTPRSTLSDTDELRAETLHRNNPAVSLPTRAKSGGVLLPTGAERGAARARARNALETEKSELLDERSALTRDWSALRRANNMDWRSRGMVNTDTAGNEKKMAELERQMQGVGTGLKRVGYVQKYQDTRKDDTFFGQFGASYDVGQMGQDEGLAWSRYLDNPTPENRAYAEAIGQVRAQYVQRNADALDGDAALPWISQDLAGYLPQRKGQIIAGLEGAAGMGTAGAVLGSAVPGIGTATGAVKGANAGYTAGRAKYGYDVSRGMAFKLLLDAGVPEDKARAAAGDEAVLTAITEAADAGLDLLTLGGGTLLKKLAGGGAKAAGTAAESALKQIFKTLAGYGVNILGEGAQEWFQEGISIANQNRVQSGDSAGLLDLTGRTAGQAMHALTGQDPEGLAQMNAAGTQGMKIAAMAGGSQLAANRLIGAGIDRIRTAPDRAIDSAYSAMQEYGPFSQEAQNSNRRAVSMLPDGLRGETSFVSLPDGLRKDRAIELLPDFKAAGTANTQTMGLDTPTVQQTQKTASMGEAGKRMTMADFTSVDSPVWNNVDYADTETQTSIMRSTHQAMVGSGRVVQIPERTTERVGQSFPDLRSMKKSERTPILRQKMNELKSALRQFLGGLKGGSYEFEVNGNVLEAKLYDTGIREVMEKITQDKASMLYHSDQVFQNAQYLYSTPDYDGDPNIYRWNYFYTPVQIGDQTVGVRIAVRDMAKTKESQIYNWGIKTGAALGGGKPGKNASSPDTSSATPVLATLDGGGGGSSASRTGVSSDASSAPIIAESALGVNTQSAQAGPESSVGAAQAGFTGDTERGYSKNLATDQNMREDIREDFRLDPEMYHRLGNKETLAKAQAIFDEGLGSARSKLEQAIGAAQAGAKLAPEMVPLSRLVANELARVGDLTAARNLLSDVAVELTQAGQLGQAANILRSADPVTVENTIQGALDRVNEAGRKRYGEKWSDFALTDEERQEIAGIDLGDEDAFSAMYEKVAHRVGAEMPSTWWEKLTEVRRVSMLLNPKTQVRNVAANVPLAVERKAAERLSGAIQDMLVKWGALDKQDQTRTLRVSRESRALAESLYAENREMLAGSADKWDMNGMLRQYRRYFGGSKPGQAMDAVRQFTYDLLEKGDTPFVRSAFLDNAAQYIEAQGYTNLDQVPQKVVDHAAQQAMEATFKDACALASWLNGIKRRGGAAGGAADIILPFTTTPVNILRRTVDYSPAGAVQALLDFRAGRRTDAADDVARALTGTGAILIGMLLAKYGLATGAADDDKDKAALDRATGESPYSLGGRVAYEWAQPVGTQLAMGARIWDAVKDQEKVSDALLNVLYAGGDTLMDMTILSNLQDLLKGYGSPTETVGETLIQGFAGQMTPSLFGAVARTLDGTVRTSYTGGGAWDNAQAGIKAKLPGLSATLPASVNVKGEENRRVEPLPLRALQEMVNPSSVNTGTRNEVDDEVYRLYETTGGKTMFPQVSPYKIEREGVDVPLTGAERARFQTTQGHTYYSIIGEMLDSEDYRGMEPEQQVKYFELVNQYAKAVAMEEATDGAYESDRYVELAQTAKKELGLSEAEYLLLYAQYGGATMNGDGIRTAYQEGVDPEAYLRYVGELKAVKGDKKSTGQVDAARALLQTEGLTDREREALWGIQGESWKEESNPFGDRCTAIRERFGLDMDIFLDALEIYRGEGKAAEKKAALRALIGPQGNALYDQLGKR